MPLSAARRRDRSVRVVPTDLRDPKTWVALSRELDSTMGLLTTGLRLLDQVRFLEGDLEPAMVCLASGAEKLLKLTYGLAVTDATGSWPSKAVMQNKYRHQISALDQECRAFIADRIDLAAAPGYIRTLLDRSASDPFLQPTLDALTRYAAQGRFHNLDVLGDSPPSAASPQQLWEDMERHITTLNPDLLARLGDVAQDWDLSRRDLARPIQRALIEWWELYWRAYMHGVFGPTGKQWGSQLQPPKAPEG